MKRQKFGRILGSFNMGTVPDSSLLPFCCVHPSEPLHVLHVVLACVRHVGHGACVPELLGGGGHMVPGVGDAAGPEPGVPAATALLARSPLVRHHQLPAVRNVLCLSLARRGLHHRALPGVQSDGEPTSPPAGQTRPLHLHRHHPALTPGLHPT